MEQCNWFGDHMRFVGIMQRCKNPGDHVLYRGFSLSLSLSLSLYIYIYIYKCVCVYVCVCVCVCNH